MINSRTETSDPSGLVNDMHDDLKYWSNNTTSDTMTSNITISTARIEEIVCKQLQGVSHKLVEEQRRQGQAVAEYLDTVVNGYDRSKVRIYLCMLRTVTL
jgi:hypothetical protein